MEMRLVLMMVVLCCVLGCGTSKTRVAPTEPPENYQSLPALWAQDIFVTRFDDYGPGEHCIQSMIRDASAVRYMVLIRVSALDETHVTVQRSPDGTEVETLEVTLQEGDAPTELVVHFTHALARHGVEKLRFSGTTIVPRQGWWQPLGEE